jgi:glycosyltransferase involved in cell wall biosynthesis
MGPLTPPFTGQSVAFTTLANALEGKLNYKILNISNRNNLLSSFKLFFQIMTTVVFSNYEAIYFTCSRSFFGSVRDVLLLSLSKLKRIRVVNHLHGSDFRQFYNNLPKIYQRILFWSYSAIDTTIILIHGMEDEFVDFPKIKTIVIANCYSKDLDNLPREKEHNEIEIHLLYLSNIMKSKGIIHLLKACEVVFAKYPHLKLDIAGAFLEDSHSNLNEITIEFQYLLHDLQLKYPDRLIYHGECKGDLKSRLLWQSDIFILPTFYKTEAFPITILEAMRAGNYILSTNYRYIPQIVKKENGLLFEPNSSDEIVTAIEKVILNRKKMIQVQNNNISYVIEKYNEAKYVKTICEVIENK